MNVAKRAVTRRSGGLAGAFMRFISQRQHSVSHQFSTHAQLHDRTTSRYALHTTNTLPLRLRSATTLSPIHFISPTGFRRYPTHSINESN